jgi:beta-glucosidase
LCLAAAPAALLRAEPGDGGRESVQHTDAAKTEARARALVAAMTLDEKIAMLHGPMPIAIPGMPADIPPEARPSAGYIRGVPRLGIPALTETDASLGVTNPGGLRAGDTATAFPSALVLAASFDPELAQAVGRVMGREARAKGFNVLLGGGVNLTRDPRGGRNFEYLGEDPLLAGMMAGAMVRGTQAEGVISTVKHFALNAHETNRHTLDARIDRAALRASDLLAFEIAIERGRPGSVMCAYNRINGAYSCGDRWLLGEVLKKDWGFTGWVMSDWGAVHATSDALAGLDQQSGEQFDKAVYFGAPLKQTVEEARIPQARIDDMVTRILRPMIDHGLLDRPAVSADYDKAAHAALALDVARRGIVLLKNDQDLLPLARTAKRIAVIGGNAQSGVLSGGGSSQVTPSNGAPIVIPVGGNGPLARLRREMWFASSPYAEIVRRAKGARVDFDPGHSAAAAADLAAKADVVILFVARHEIESLDAPDMMLGRGQDELVEAVTAANPRTIVVLQTGNPVAMPWRDRVPAILAAWFPGQEGGTAIAETLFGEVNPSGHLPMSWPARESDLVHPRLPNRGAEEGAEVAIDYSEGADVGYRGFERRGVRPAFAFGHGLGYTDFAVEGLRLRGCDRPQAEAVVTNIGKRRGAHVVQLYLRERPQGREARLVGFARVELDPGEARRVSLAIDPRLLADFSEEARRWTIAAGRYRFEISPDALDREGGQWIALPARSLAP